ncbi:hypothetical protein AB0383_20375 [Amycolatopsis sp. NPDC051373]|uniref:hypothetical protein n=1 Tax=Amycolatopsis sp. NPDC051373 TaxID=3155801 RepID=UPI00344EC0DA
MSEPGAGETLWRIALRDDLLVTMIGSTNPEPYWAKDEAERDWALEHQLHRPREDYVVEEVPGPHSRAIADERERRRLLLQARHEHLRGSRP